MSPTKEEFRKALEDAQANPDKEQPKWLHGVYLSCPVQSGTLLEEVEMEKALSAERLRQDEDIRDSLSRQTLRIAELEQRLKDLRERHASALNELGETGEALSAEIKSLKAESV